MKKHLANILTSFRLVGALVLIAFPIRSKVFLFLYLLCGLTDILDGYVARKTHTESALGRKLDSVSDLLLYGVMLRKAWPLLQEALPKAGLYSIMGLILARLCLYVIYGLLTHRFLSTHSLFNKATSLLVFFLPFGLLLKRSDLYCYLSMSVAGLSILDEALHFFPKKA